MPHCDSVCACHCGDMYYIMAMCLRDMVCVTVYMCILYGVCMCLCLYSFVVCVHMYYYDDVTVYICVCMSGWLVGMCSCIVKSIDLITFRMG